MASQMDYLRQCLLNCTQFYKIFRNFITALWTEQETKEGITQETVIQSKIDILYSESLNFYINIFFDWHEQKKVVENTIHLLFSLAYYKCDFTFGQRKIIYRLHSCLIQGLIHDISRTNVFIKPLLFNSIYVRMVLWMIYTFPWTIHISTNFIQELVPTFDFW